MDARCQMLDARSPTSSIKHQSSSIQQPRKDPDMIGGGTIVKDPISHQPKITATEQGATADDALNQIRDSLRGLRFGSVNIIVQDGVVIQIDRTEKRRLRNSRTTP